MTIRSPSRIEPGRFRTHFATADRGLEVSVAVDASSHDSPVQLGLTRIQPGTEQDSWEADDATHEVYYVISGSVKLGWSGPDSGESVVTAGECFYFPPGRAYTIENAGIDEVFLVWVVSPSPSAATA